MTPAINKEVVEPVQEARKGPDEVVVATGADAALWISGEYAPWLEENHGGEFTERGVCCCLDPRCTAFGHVTVTHDDLE